MLSLVLVQDLLPSLQADRDAGNNGVTSLSREITTAVAETTKLRRAADILTWAVLKEEAEGAGTTELLKAALGNVEVSYAAHASCLHPKCTG